MRRHAAFLSVVVSAAFLSGCVERRYVVTTDPPYAVVVRNNQPLGASPADDHFIYYGTYHFTIMKDGYQTLQVDQKIPAPWYEYPPFDFVAENLVPWRIQDVRRFHYVLEPAKAPEVNQLLPAADNLRNKGKSLEAPAPDNPQ